METRRTELIECQLPAVAESGETPATLADPKTCTQSLLNCKVDYDPRTDPDFDDSPWTPEEREALAWEAGKHAGWEEMDEFDNTLAVPALSRIV